MTYRGQANGRRARGGFRWPGKRSRKRVFFIRTGRFALNLSPTAAEILERWSEHTSALDAAEFKIPTFNPDTGEIVSFNRVKPAMPPEASRDPS